MAPSDDKIDLPRLEVDLTKYQPWLSQKAVDWWTQFNVNTVYCEQNDNQNAVEWPLLDLQDGKFTTSTIILDPWTIAGYKLIIYRSFHRQGAHNSRRV